MSEKFIINGGKPLKGTVQVRGAKNAVFPILAAALLTKRVCIIENVPLIEDVFRMNEILKSIGVKVSWPKERTLKIRANKVNVSKIKKDIISKFRGSVLLYGPLLARFGEVKLPQPGGCLIGARPIDVHLDAFSQMGVKISSNKNFYSLENKPPTTRRDALAPSGKTSGRRVVGGSDRTITLNEFSVTGTENIILFASLLPQKTIIKGADLDYPVQELIKFLKKMGVKIKVDASYRIFIEGSKKLNGAEHKLISDPIEAGTFIIAAAATKGDVIIENVEISFLELFLKKLKDSGLAIEKMGPKRLRIKPWKTLKINKVQGLPYPGIATDLLSCLGVLATQAEGSTLIHDPLYEGRFKYLEELNKMGARIIFCDPHRVIINGPSKLYGKELGPFDLRGGAALIIAGLIAEGKTVIDNVYQIDRGYERIEERLQKLGADIRRIKE